MSKFSQALTATLTGNVIASRRVKPQHYSIDKHVAVTSFSGETKKQYKVGVKFEQVVWVHSEDSQENVLSDIRAAFIEELFGEFRPIISEMRGALYNEDTVCLRGLIAELNKKMFE